MTDITIKNVPDKLKEQIIKRVMTTIKINLKKQINNDSELKKELDTKMQTITTANKLKA